MIHRNSLRMGLLVAAIGLTTVALPACSTTKPVGMQVDDSMIATKVKAKFAGDPEVTARDVNVEVNEGVVTLLGRVKTDSEKNEAEKLARQTEGVRRVVNLLKVGDIEARPTSSGTPTYSGQTNPMSK